MKKIGLLLLLFLLVVLWPMISNSEQPLKSLKATWDENLESDLGGYKMYIGLQPSVYNYGNPVDMGIPPKGSDGRVFYNFSLQAGQTYYVAIKAYDMAQNHSGHSNEVVVMLPPEYPLDQTYSASAEYQLNIPDGIIYGEVTTLPADPKTVGWTKTNLVVNTGQVVHLDLKAFYNNTTAVPISLWLEDEATGNWLSSERVLYADINYPYVQTDLIAMLDSANATLVVSTGHRTGIYEFQQIQITVTDPLVAVVEDVFLKQLLPKISTGLFSAEWQFFPPQNTDGTMVRIAQTRKEIEKGVAGILIGQQLLPPGQNTFRLDIPSTLYGGIYAAFSNVFGSDESVPWITWYMPGDIYATADELIPPLGFQGGVDATDNNYAYAGYTSNRIVPALTPDTPAGREERTDIDNNGRAGRISDYSFIRSQYLNGRKMQ